MAASSRAVVDVEDCGCDTMGCSGGSERSFLFEGCDGSSGGGGGGSSGFGSTLVCDSYKKAQRKLKFLNFSLPRIVLTLAHHCSSCIGASHTW